MKIIIINGPNLNLLGTREPEIYGNQTFESFFSSLKSAFPSIDLHYFQSNHEGKLIDKLHEIGFMFDGIILNAGGYSHTSIALADAISSITTPVVEVHISNTFAREKYRHQDLLTSKCAGLIVGLGFYGYTLALQYLMEKK